MNLAWTLAWTSTQPEHYAEYRTVITMLGFAATVIGIAVATFTVARNQRWQRLQGYQRLHEKLVDPSAARGRRMLFLTYEARRTAEKQGRPVPPLGARAASCASPQGASVALLALPCPGCDAEQREYDAARYTSPGDPAWDEINYALALYDTLGGYVEQRLVPLQHVLRAWHHPLQSIAPVVAEFGAHRRGLGITQPWSYLDSLLAANDQYICRCRVCGTGKWRVRTQSATMRIMRFDVNRIPEWRARKAAQDTAVATGLTNRLRMRGQIQVHVEGCSKHQEPSANSGVRGD